MIQNHLNSLTIPSKFIILNKFNKFQPYNPSKDTQNGPDQGRHHRNIHQELGFPQKKSTELVEQLIETIKSTLASGEDVLVSGFGKFCVNEKKERRGRNPATGDSMMLRPRRVVTFKCLGEIAEEH